MPFALLIIGAVLLIAAVRGQQDVLFGLLKNDFTGQSNFIFWMAAILVIGAIGYIPKVKPISIAMLALVVIVLFLKKGDPSGLGGGVFAQFTSGLASTQTAATASGGGTVASPLGNLPSLPSITNLVQ
jgi:hypothetical protein